MSEQYWKDRADALERALLDVQALIPDRHAPGYNRDVRSLESAIDSIVKTVNTTLYTPADQPAQGGGRMEAEGRRGMDRREQVKCVAQLAEVSAKVYSMGHHQDCAMSGDSGSFCDCGYEIAKKIAESEKYGTVDELVGPNAEINEVCKYADQTADAGEPSCCARTREAERERCARVADEDNPAYSKLDRYTADEIAAAIRRTGDTQ
jgi:hypothetical protein